MPATETLSEKAILAIPLDEPERLFGPEPGRLADVYRVLAKKWHPDRNGGDPRSRAVFEHIALLKGEASSRAAKGDWRRPGVVRFDAVDGRSYDLSFRRKHAFELGEIYVAPTAIAYALRLDVSDFAAHAKRTMASISYADAGMRKVFEPRMPNLKGTFATRDRVVFVLSKTPDQFLLRDLLAHLGGRLDPRHVAWIVSDLESEASFLDLPSVSLVHPALGPDTLLVSPRYHTVSVVGGWWYAARKGDRLLGVPDRTADNVPPVLFRPEAADVRLMLETIRLTASECLGHANASLARRDASIPDPLRQWLVGTPSDSAVEDYRSWAAAREASFGARRFVELAVDPDDLYRPNP